MLETALLDDAKFDAVQRELLEITWRLVNAINTGDAATYAELSRADMSCFEDVCAYRIDGLEFHLALIRQMGQNPDNQPTRLDLLSPRVQIYGETGIVTYTRLMTYDRNGSPLWKTFNESRVFVKEDGKWKMVHFHRTPT